MVENAPKPTSGPTRPAGLKRRLADVVVFLQIAWAVIVAELNAVRGAPLVVVPLVVCALLMGTGQGADLTVTAGSDTCKAAWMVLATAFYSFQCWFWARLIVERRESRAAPDIPPWALKMGEWLQDWTPRLLGAAPFFIAVMAAFNAKVDLKSLPWIFVALGAAAPFVFRARRPVADHFQLTNGDLFYRTSQWGTLALGLTSLAALCLWPVGPAQFMGAIGVVFLGLAFITAALAWGLSVSRAARLPILAALLLSVAVFSLWNDNHEVGRRTFPRQTAVMPLPPPAPARDDFEADPLTGKETLAMRLLAWCAAQGPTGCSTDPAQPTPIVFVAAEGGASRAGYWAADVLGKLQHDTPRARPFSDRVFAISSVSGGSVGVMAYVSTLADTPKAAGALFGDGLVDVAGVDFLSPAMGGLLFPDLAQRFLPAPLLPDRAETLETGFESGWRQHCRSAPTDGGHVQCGDRELWTKAFLSLWRETEGAKTGKWLPVVLINGARQEDGRRIITANVAVTPEIFPDAVDFHALTNRDVRVSTAILNGARFPLVSPGGTLVDRYGKRQGHVLDGGYFDGGGVVTMADTAAAVLRIANTRRFALKPVFIELNNDSDSDENAADLIRAGGAEACRAQAEAGQEPSSDCKATALFPSATHDVVADLIGPLDGLASARGAHTTAAAMALAQVVKNHGGEASPSAKATSGEAAETEGPGEWGVSPTYRLVHLCKTEDVKIPMDWALSKSAKRRADEILGISVKAPGASPSKTLPPEAAADVEARDKKARESCQVTVRLEEILKDVRTPGADVIQIRRAPGVIDDGALWIWLRLAVIAAILGAAANFWADQLLHRAGLPTTVSLQRCRSKQDFKGVIEKWSPEASPNALAYVWTAYGADFLFMAGYAVVGVVLAQLLINHQPVHDDGTIVSAWLVPVFRTGAGLVVLAAAADAFEDLSQMRMIGRDASDRAAGAAHVATLLKWLSLGLGVLLLLGAAVFGCERGG
jgi:hypothetical protein